MRIPWLTIGAGLLALGAQGVWAEQKPPAERAGMDPSARGKVASVMARSYLHEPSARATADRAVQRAGVGTGANPGGCTTNIGTSATPQGAGNRYGAGSNKDQVIVVKGPVVNVCR